MRKFIFVFATLCIIGSNVEAKSKHALPKSVAAAAFVAKNAPHAATATVKAASKSLKVTLGSVLFATETVNDVILGGLDGLDKVASTELKYNPFHYAYYVDDKIDVGLEAAETFFFGSHN